MAGRRFRVPHTLVLLFGMVVAALLLTYLLPTGSFDPVENEAGRLQVVPGSFERTSEMEPLSHLCWFRSAQSSGTASQRPFQAVIPTSHPTRAPTGAMRMPPRIPVLAPSPEGRP